MKGDQMGILAAYPTQRELPLSNQTRFNLVAVRCPEPSRVGTDATLDKVQHRDVDTVQGHHDRALGRPAPGLDPDRYCQRRDGRERWGIADRRVIIARETLGEQ